MNAIVFKLATHEGAGVEMAMREYFAVVLLLAGITFLAMAAYVVCKAPTPQL